MADRYEIPWAAMPKARPRAGQGRIYMPREYMEWKANVAEFVELHDPTMFRAPVSLSVALRRDAMELEVFSLANRVPSRSGMLTGDVDNYLGGVMDALEGVLWKNDRLVEDVRGYFR